MSLGIQCVAEVGIDYFFGKLHLLDGIIVTPLAAKNGLKTCTSSPPLSSKPHSAPPSHLCAHTPPLLQAMQFKVMLVTVPTLSQASTG